MDPYSEIKFLEKCRVAPPPDAVPEFILPLTFYDLQFLCLPPVQHLHFYRFRHLSPNSGFIISSLKSSLSILLKHFLPVAGNLVCPVYSAGMPELRYVKGDSVSLTIAESTENFDYLSGNQQKDHCKFDNLLPELQEPFVISGSEISPLFALQVTVFPNYGISIGRTILHVLGDATAFKHFNRLWASMDNFNGDSVELLSISSQPIYDRSTVQDPYNLSFKIYNEMKLILKSQPTSRISNPTIYKHKVRTTFMLHPLDIIKLKKFMILARNHSFGGDNVSSFTVVCALIWTCLSKSLGVVNDKVECDKPENLLLYINCRKHFDSSIPQNYFGNCVVPCIVGSTHGKLVGKEGLFKAAYGIKNAIHKRVHDSEGILKGDWIKHTAVDPDALLIIVGSIQHELYNYNADFNWGVLEKHEHLSINSSVTKMLIALSPRIHGAVEVGISLPKDIMNAFTIIFTDCINNLHIRSPM